MKILALFFITFFIAACEPTVSAHDMMCGWSYKYSKTLISDDDRVCFAVNPPNDIAVMPEQVDSCAAESFSGIYRNGDTVYMYNKVGIDDDENHVTFQMIVCPD